MQVYDLLFLFLSISQHASVWGLVSSIQPQHSYAHAIFILKTLIAKRLCDLVLVLQLVSEAERCSAAEGTY